MARTASRARPRPHRSDLPGHLAAIGMSTPQSSTRMTRSGMRRPDPAYRGRNPYRRTRDLECERRESNPHTFRYRNLNPARLPVPPLSRMRNGATRGGAAGSPGRVSLPCQFASRNRRGTAAILVRHARRVHRVIADQSPSGGKRIGTGDSTQSASLAKGPTQEGEVRGPGGQASPSTATRASFSGLRITKQVRIRPSAMSKVRTLRGWPS